MHTLLPFCDYTVAVLVGELPGGKKKVSKLQLLPPGPRMASAHLTHQPMIKETKEKKKKGLYCSVQCKSVFVCSSLESRFNSSCSELYKVFGRLERDFFQNKKKQTKNQTVVRRAWKSHVKYSRISLASIPLARLCKESFFLICVLVMLLLITNPCLLFSL